jgi:outer membrane protein assembly factor BamE (lipoprotein component of BamABCDE complex)
MVLALILSACASIKLGREFDLQAFETRVQQGETTRAQVQDWLGNPTSTGVSVDTSGRRFEEWTYYSGQGRLPGMKDASFKILQIKFDQDGVVRGYEYSAD